MLVPCFIAYQRPRVFKIGSKFDKDAQFYVNPLIEGAWFEDASRKTALPRRNMMASAFNREGVRRSEHRVAQCVSKFLARLNEYAKDEKPLDMTRGSMCLAADAAMNFTFHKPYGALDAENFQSELLVPVIDFSRMQQWPVYFPNLLGAMFKIPGMLPKWVIGRYFKGIITQQECLQVSSRESGHAYCTKRSSTL